MIHFFNKIEIRYGALLPMLLMWIVGDMELVAVAMGNAAIHEYGHYLALKRYRVRVRRLIFDHTGFNMLCNTSYLPNSAAIIVALAGPILGFVGALIFSVIGNLLQCERLLLFSGAGVILSVFNLLPILPLDGGRVVQILAPTISAVIGTFCSVLILIFGIYLMVQGYGTMAAMLGVILLLRDFKQEDKVAYV